ncbi:MAG: hypothetical protein ACRDZO_20485 [Egibacteraceae bacterium]
MNELLAPVWTERVTRLHLGVEPVDALGRPGPLGGLGLHVEHVPRPAPLPTGIPAPVPFGDIGDNAGLPGVAGSPSGRFALTFGRAALDALEAIVVRVVDPRRRYVPRRLSIPVPDLATVLAAEAAHDQDPAAALTPRTCRPTLFPGAAYGVAAGATAVRGRVIWGAGGPPVQWARVAALTEPIEIRAEDGTVTTVQPVLGRAHGDHRGEFLLVLGPLPTELALGTSQTADVVVRVTARPEPAPGAPVDSPTGSRADPLWHLPVERVASLDPADQVAAGTVEPAGFTASTVRTLTCRRGFPPRASFTFVLP